MLHGGARQAERFYSRFWISAARFWRGPSARVSSTLAGLLVVIVVVQLAVQYRLNIWNRDFFDALSTKDGPVLWAQARVFLGLAFMSIILAVLSVWGRMTLQRKWRESVTRDVIEHWLRNGRYRRLKRAADENQQADARIAQDARVATDSPVDLALGLLSSLLGAALFVGVLWNVGGRISLDAFGQSLIVPGYLVIAVILYSGFTTVAMLAIGRHLTRVIQNLNQAEATFRSAANCLCEAAHGMSTGNGEATMRRELSTGFDQVLIRWRELLWQLLGTTVVTEGNSLIAPVVGWVLCLPKYLAGTMSLGELTQAAAAFVIVQGAFNWLVNNYQRVADWASSANRVGELLTALDDLAQGEPEYAMES